MTSHDEIPVATSHDEALEALADAKADLRESPHDPEARAAHAAAAQELRYQRWVARGGPGEAMAAAVRAAVDKAPSGADGQIAFDAAADMPKAHAGYYERWGAESEG